jgi:hypothetical protein
VSRYGSRAATSGEDGQLILQLNDQRLATTLKSVTARPATS